MRFLFPCGGLFMSFVVPATDAADLSLNELEPMVISGTRTESPPGSTPAGMTVITRGQIAESGASTVIDVLRGQAGVLISDQLGDGSRPIVSMRGFGGNAQANSLILVDGRRLNNTDLSAPDLNSIAIEDVERIEIVQGSAGVLYGDQAVGGVVHIVTRTAGRRAAGVRMGLGSYGRQLQGGRIEGRHDSGLNGIATLERRRTDNHRDNDDLHYVNGFGRLGYDWDGGGAFAEFQRVDEDHGMPGALFAGQIHADRRQTRFPDDRTDTRTENGRLGLRQDIGRHLQLLAEFTNRYSESDGVLIGTPYTQSRHHRELTPRLIATYPLRAGPVVLTAGADLFASDYHILSSFAFGPATTDNTQEMGAGYAQLVLPLVDAFTLTGGLRRAVVENNLTDTFAFPAGTEIDDAVTVGSFGVTVRLNNETRLLLRWDQNYRFPLVDEHTFTLPGGRLRPQTGQSHEAGLEWSRGGNRLRLAGYRLRLNDEIDFDPTLNCFFGTCVGANVNLDPTRRFGILAEGAWQALPELRFGAHYSFVDARFAGGPLRGNEIPAVARQQLRVDGAWRLGQSLSLYGEVQAVGGRHGAADYDNTLARLPGHTVGNLHLIYEQGGWSLAARVSNLLDRQYSDYAAAGYNPFPVRETSFYPAPERNFWLTLKYEYR